MGGLEAWLKETYQVPPIFSEFFDFVFREDGEYYGVGFFFVETDVVGLFGM